MEFKLQISTGHLTRKIKCFTNLHIPVPNTMPYYDRKDHIGNAIWKKSSYVVLPVSKKVIRLHSTTPAKGLSIVELKLLVAHYKSTNFPFQVISEVILNHRCCIL